MTPDRDDPLLDACLDEVLGGRRPPDLTARIMQALAERASANGNAHPAPLPPPVVAAPPIAAPGVNGRPMVELSPRGLARGRRSRGLEAWLVVAGVLVVGLSIALAAYVASSRPDIAANPPATNDPPSVAIADSNAVKSPAQTKSPAVPRDRQPAVVQVPDSKGSGARTPPDTAPQVADNKTPPAVTPAPPKQYLDPSPDAEIVSFVNAEIARGWTDAGVKPAPPATDAEWCRRLFVRVLGRIPTIAELDEFTADKSPDRRQQLIQRLLSDENYVAEYANHWSVVFSNVLIGRTGGKGTSLASREGLEQYLRTALAKNKPYTDVVHELLTATGSAQPGASDHNPAVNFLLDGWEKDATLATARVSRVFLGHQLQCAQCHQHPSQEWSQEQFWAFNSFFRQMQVRREAGTPKLVNVSFSGQGRGSSDGEVYYETPAGLLKTAYPKFIDGTAIPASGDLTEVDRRAELARLVVQSEHLPKALVNRVWSHFFGYGFTRPVDDLGPATTPSHPQVLDRLAHEFAARDFDLRSVIRWVALSDPFSRSSRLTDIATKDMPEAGEVALFSRYYSRPMQAEEVYNSLVQAAQIRKTAANESAVEKARVDWLSQFTRNMGTDDAEEELHTGGVRQSLIMMNGELMKQATSGPQAGLIQSVAASDMQFEKKVEHLFLSALSRPPSRNEQAAASTILRNSKNNQQSALEDIWWAILNSNEFILDH